MGTPLFPGAHFVAILFLVGKEDDLFFLQIKISTRGGVLWKIPRHRITVLPHQRMNDVALNEATHAYNGLQQASKLIAQPLCEENIVHLPKIETLVCVAPVKELLEFPKHFGEHFRWKSLHEAKRPETFLRDSCLYDGEILGAWLPEEEHKEQLTLLKRARTV